MITKYNRMFFMSPPPPSLPPSLLPSLAPSFSLSLPPSVLDDRHLERQDIHEEERAQEPSGNIAQRPRRLLHVLSDQRPTRQTPFSTTTTKSHFISAVLASLANAILNNTKTLPCISEVLPSLGCFPIFLLLRNYVLFCFRCLPVGFC